MPDHFRLVERDWGRVFTEAIAADNSRLRIVCPFIKVNAIRQLLSRVMPQRIEVITRFKLDDFAKGVSDIGALRTLLNAGAKIRGVRNLHAKLYLFGDSQAVLTSANLTEKALTRNHEFGCLAGAPGILARCNEYFEALWRRAGRDLAASLLDEWDREVTGFLAQGARPSQADGLGDAGADLGNVASPDEIFPMLDGPGQAFIKFFGESHDRAPRGWTVLREVQRSGCHWACTYPRGKRPRSVADGALMFMGRLVSDPSDILVYGLANGMRHVPGRDDASEEDLKRRGWKSKWPHYVRVHHAQFLAGNLENGVSMNLLMETLGSEAFAPTQRNASRGEGNTNPRKAYNQQASVELTPNGASWLMAKLQVAFERHGKMPPAVMESELDWPTVA